MAKLVEYSYRIFK